MVVGEFSAVSAMSGSMTSGFAGLVARLSDVLRRKLGSGGVGGTGAVTDACYVV